MPLTKDQSLQKYGTEAYTAWGETEAEADAKAKGLSGGAKTTSTGSGSTDYSSILKQQQEASQAAIAPAVEALKSSIPTTQAKYQALSSQASAEIEPLKARYQTLIDELKSKGTQSEQAQTKVTAGEMGKRGIPLTSTLAQQEITSAVQPITSETASNIKTTGLQQEADLRTISNTLQNLGLSENEAVNAINTAIAQAQAGAGSGAISNALNLYQTNTASAQSKATQDLQNLIYENVTLPSSTANIANIQSEIANRNKTTTDSDWMSTLLQQILGQNAGTANTGGTLPQYQLNGDWTTNLGIGEQ